MTASWKRYRALSLTLDWTSYYSCNRNPHANFWTGRHPVKRTRDKLQNSPHLTSDVKHQTEPREDPHVIISINNRQSKHKGFSWSERYHLDSSPPQQPPTDSINPHSDVIESPVFCSIAPIQPHCSSFTHESVWLRSVSQFISQSLYLALVQRTPHISTDSSSILRSSIPASGLSDNTS